MNCILPVDDCPFRLRHRTRKQWIASALHPFIEALPKIHSNVLVSRLIHEIIPLVWIER